MSADTISVMGPSSLIQQHEGAKIVPPRKPKPGLTESETPVLNPVDSFKGLKTIGELGYHYFIPVLLGIGVWSGHVRIGQPDSEQQMVQMAGISNRLIVVAEDFRTQESQRIDQGKQRIAVDLQLAEAIKSLATEVHKQRVDINDATGKPQIKFLKEP